MFPTVLECPECESEIDIEDVGAGDKVECPECEAVLLVKFNGVDGYEFVVVDIPLDEDEDEEND